MPPPFSLTETEIGPDTVQAHKATVKLRVHRMKNGFGREAEGLLANEAPLEIVVNNHLHSVLMRTPGAEKELAAGHLLCEGLIQSGRDISEINISRKRDGNGHTAHVVIKRPFHPASTGDGPMPYTTSSGAKTVLAWEELRFDKAGPFGGPRFSSLLILHCFGILRDYQPLYRLTRGVHASAVFEADGALYCCHEDVGRHNALDKSIGQALLTGRRLDDKMVVLSGRASLEMVLKAAKAGLPLVICSSSPTAPAVRAADDLRLTLVKPEDDRSLIVYSHAWRLDKET